MGLDNGVVEEILAKQQEGVFVPLNKELSLYVYDDIESISKIWDDSNEKGILNASIYQKAVEAACPKDLKTFYTILYKDGNPKGFFLFQVKRFSLNEALDIHTHSDKFLTKLWTTLKQQVTKLVKHDLLIVGNVLVTGQYGINYCSSLDFDSKLNALNVAIDGFADYLNKHKKYKVRSVLIKDFKSKDDGDVKLPDYAEFVVDPYMYIDIQWGSMDEYLDAIKSKYRVRYKRAIKKGSGFIRKELDATDLVQYRDEMYSLYKQISKNVTFNLFDLNPDYFIELRKKLGELILIQGIFLEGKLVAFYSLIHDLEHNEIDAHFLGYDMSTNQAKQTYLNILYFILEDSILAKAKKVNLSRTAMEIKSSVGAKGFDLFLLLKHRNGLINSLLHRFLGSFVPDNEWQPRDPFKGN